MYLEDAIALAATRHRGQVDKLGEPYILHVLAVMLAVPPALRVAAVLHDVIEDTGMLPAHLLDLGVSEADAALITTLTHRAYESYDLYLDRIIDAGPDAMEIKKADLDHNLDRVHLVKDSAVRDRLRRKYLPAVSRLRRALKRLASKKGDVNA